MAKEANWKRISKFIVFFDWLKEIPFAIKKFWNGLWTNRVGPIYRKLTEACQTNASNKKNRGMVGKTSTIGSNGA